MFLRILTLLTIGVGVYYNVDGHGRLVDPPGRSTLWRTNSAALINYDDNQLNCGGFLNQYNKENNGNCGICGDPYQDTVPRANEAGGLYGNGIITKIYSASSDIDVTVQITAYQKGYFEFRLCEWNKPSQVITQDCLNKHLLADKSTGNTQMPIGSSTKNYTFTLSLPSGLTCSQCVLQWKYNTGNIWGIGQDGKGCVGCGNQEQFYACSDIAIV